MYNDVMYRVEIIISQHSLNVYNANTIILIIRYSCNIIIYLERCTHGYREANEHNGLDVLGVWADRQQHVSTIAQFGFPYAIWPTASMQLCNRCLTWDIVLAWPQRLWSGSSTWRPLIVGIMTIYYYKCLTINKIWYYKKECQGIK